MALAAYLVFASGHWPSLETMQDAILKLLGKSSTLTGRTKLWPWVIENARYHNPWLGGGYSAFWNGPESPSGYTVWKFGQYMGQSHDSYVDLNNDLGYLGLIGRLCFIWPTCGIFGIRRYALAVNFIFISFCKLPPDVWCGGKFFVQGDYLDADHVLPISRLSPVCTGAFTNYAYQGPTGSWFYGIILQSRIFVD